MSADDRVAGDASADASAGTRPEPGPIAVLPDASSRLADAVIRAGGELGALDDRTRGLVWTSSAGGAELAEALRAAPGVGWVQLPWAGVDAFAEVLRAARGDGRVWTSGKGVYARPVAEHALALVLALSRVLPERVRAGQWRPDESARSLFGARVVILGAGGITSELLRLLEPFGVDATVVRRSGGPLAGATRTVTGEQQLDAVAGADVLVVAAALTPETRGAVDAAVLGALAPGAIVVNVGRGPIVDTTALVAALESGRLGGAGLDVTDPEPLPAGHPLWRLPNTIVTPHVADSMTTTPALLEARVETNVRAFLEGREFAGLIDLEQGY